MAIPKHVSKLRNRPELATEIGLIIADYAAIEFMLFTIFAMLSRLNPEETFGAFFSQRSIKRKTKLLEDEIWRLLPALQVGIKRILRRMKGAAARRAEIAHAHSMEGVRGLMRLHLIGEQAALAPLDEAFIDRTTDQFRTLAIDLLNYAAVLMTLAPDLLKARLDRLFVPIDGALQRRPVPQGGLGRLEEDERAASDKRLGLEGP